jgi:hypothetical protein
MAVDGERSIHVRSPFDGLTRWVSCGVLVKYEVVEVRCSPERPVLDVMPVNP